MEENPQKCLYGVHPVLEAVNSGRKIEKVLFRQGMEGQQFRELMQAVQEKGIPFQFVPVERLNKVSKGGVHQGVAAYVEQFGQVSIEEMVNNAFAIHKDPVLVILDGVSDVRNFGAIARTLECAGGSGCLTTKRKEIAFLKSFVYPETYRNCVSGGHSGGLSSGKNTAVNTAQYYDRHQKRRQSADSPGDKLFSLLLNSFNGIQFKREIVFPHQIEIQKR